MANAGTAHGVTLLSPLTYEIATGNVTEKEDKSLMGKTKFNRGGWSIFDSKFGYYRYGSATPHKTFHFTLLNLSCRYISNFIKSDLPLLLNAFVFNMRTQPLCKIIQFVELILLTIQCQSSTKKRKERYCITLFNRCISTSSTSFLSLFFSS